MFKSLAALCGALILAAGTADAAGLRGEYVEARTNDVFTGPCFSNAEVYTTGHQAVIAWKVTEGSFKGVDLAGLAVAAAVRGTSTFDADQPDQAQAVLIVDKKATPAQREALVAMAKSLGGDRLKNVVAVRDSVIAMTVGQHESESASQEHGHHAMPQAPRAFFWAPGLAEIVTRPLNEDDHKCGNEVLAYPPLSKGVDVKPAYTVNNSFRGQGLNTRWDDQNARSSMVGSFAL
ncbi:MAG TPA: DUF1326 domain-containing protein [Isosphaeraceae bacterium]